MANAALNDKRAQAAYLTKRANHKISRLRSKADVEVANTKYDPRSPKKNISRYTERQLDAYIARVSLFNDRSTQYVGDAQRRPIPASEFKQAAGYREAHRKHMADRLTTIGGIRLPGVDGKPGAETIRQRRDKMRSDRKLAGNPSTNDPFDVQRLTPNGIPSREALKKLTRDLKRKTVTGWDDKELKRQIGEFSKMVNKIGDKELAANVKKLTPGQFFALWNGTGFATAVSMQYEQTQALLQDKDKPWHAQLIHDAFEDARRLVDWAKKLDL